MRRRRVLGAATQPDAIVRLQQKFEYPDAVGIGGGVDLGLDSGGEMSVSVAASDASELSKSKADFVCVAGIDDRITFEDACESIGWDGKVVLSEGAFTFDSRLLRASGGGDVTFEGMGQNETTITTGTVLGELFRATTGIKWTWKDLTMDGADNADSSITTSQASNADIYMIRVTVKDFAEEGVDIFRTGGEGRIVDCLFFSNADHGFRVRESHLDFFNCRFKNNGGAGLAIVQDSDQMIIGCWFSDNTTEGIVTGNAVSGSNSGWLLMDNRFISNGTDAVRIQDGGDWAILNNYFEGHTNSLKFGAGGFGDSADNWISGNYSTDTNFIAGDGDSQLIGVNSVNGVVESGPLYMDQSRTAGALPVLTLDQADVDEDFFKFIGISDTNVDRALVDAVDFTTPGAIAGWLKINIQDDQATNPITDGDYYIPFYAAPSA